jgi:hypothetical protein
MNRNHVLGGFIFIFGTFLGLSITRVPFLTLNSDVDIIEIGNLIFLIFLSFIIPLFITKRMDNDRVQKDMLIEEVAIFCSHLEIVNDVLEVKLSKELDQEGYKKILSSLKKSRQSFELLKEQLVEVSPNKLDTDVSSLEELLEGYWEFLTGDSGVKPQCYVVKSTFIWKQNKLLGSINRNARKLGFKINNL